MPFGKKKVGEREVDFTAIFKDIFEPAIREAKTPEGKALIPARTDMDAFSSSINQDMFEYIIAGSLLPTLAASTPMSSTKEALRLGDLARANYWAALASTRSTSSPACASAWP